MRRCMPRWASEIPTKTPLILPLRPPAPPRPPPPTAAPNAPSTSRNGQISQSSSPIAGPSTSTLPEPRLDYHGLLNDTNATTQNHILRRSGLHKDHVSHLQRLRDTQLLLVQKLQTIRAKQKDIGSLIKSKAGDTDEAIRQAKKLKSRVGDYESNLSATEAELLELGLALPNWTHHETPLGPEENARTLETFGPEPIGADPRLDHLRVAQYWDLVDNDATAIATGSSWPYLKGALAMLEIALIQYALSIAIKRGFTPVIPPDVIKQDLAWRCGFAPRDEGNTPTQKYRLEGGNLLLAGTAEIPLAALFANQIIPQEDLPRKVVGVGHAFRAEAGARGADTRGLYRVHQFTKVELFAVTDQEGSKEMMEEIRGVQKEVAQGLGLSVRVLDMPTEELGASAYRKYDMEAWMPGRGKWGEVSLFTKRSLMQITSTSNCTDYQSRRLHIRYRPNSTSAPAPGEGSGEAVEAQGPLPFAHTLNGTAAAIPRLLVALLENGVRLDGQDQPETLDLPRCLERFWIGGDVVGVGKRKGQIRWI